jgi:hypothetical protein
MYTALQAIMYRPASSALVAEDRTFFMICAIDVQYRPIVWWDSGIA